MAVTMSASRVEPSAPDESELWVDAIDEDSTLGQGYDEDENEGFPTTALLDPVSRPAQSPVLYEYRSDQLLYTADEARENRIPFRTQQNQVISTPVLNHLQDRFRALHASQTQESDESIIDDLREEIHDEYDDLIPMDIPSAGNYTSMLLRNESWRHGGETEETPCRVISFPQQECSFYFCDDGTSAELRPTSAIASGVAGALMVTLVIGAVPGVLAGLYAMHVHTREGAAGDISRALGEVALITRERAVIINTKHQLMARAQAGMIMIWKHLKELDRRHHLLRKLKRLSKCAWLKTLEFAQTNVHLLQETSSEGNERRMVRSRRTQEASIGNDRLYHRQLAGKRRAPPSVCAPPH